MPDRVRAFVRSGWLPAALAVVFHTLILNRYEVPGTVMLRYGIWLAWGIVLPGTIVWRMFRGKPRPFIEDVWCGAALGFAMEILVYLFLRSIDLPEMIVAWPALVLVAFSARPGVRQRWLRRSEERAPVSWVWAMALLICVIDGWLAIRSFRTQALNGITSQFPYVDLPYHLSLATEIRNHMPPTWPYVLGDLLHHHWFAHAEMAASNWATGIELRMILLRLQLFPMMSVLMMVMALTASRLSKRWWPGPFAVLFGFLVSGVLPYSWTQTWFFDEHRLLADYFWESPSSLVAAPLFAPVGLLMVERLRRAYKAPGEWYLIVLLLAAAMGAKSTIMPLFLAGALFVAGLELITRLRIDASSRIAIVIGIPLLAFATEILYGGQSYGLSFKPFDYLRLMRNVIFLNLTRGDPPAPLPTGPTWAFMGLALTSWLARGAGAIGFLSRRNRGAGRPAAFMLGIAIAGVCGPLLFTHPGFSELYFLRSAMPFIGILGAAGLASLVPHARKAAPVVFAILVALAVGGTSAWLISRAFWIRPSFEATGSRPESMWLLAKPFFVIAVMCVDVAVLIALLCRPIRWLRGIGAALVLALATGTGLPVTVRDLSNMATELQSQGLDNIQLPTDARPIPDSGLTAGRWLRDHSVPDDVVATNVHCRTVADYGACDNRHFWISAYSERRVLVEGWGYTEQAISNSIAYGPFQDEERLTENDLAFQMPSIATIDNLRYKWGVRWLFVDERYDRPSPELGEYATLRFRAGPCVVYELS